MSVETVRQYLDRWQRGQDIIEYPVSSATVELAAEAAYVIPARIAKSLTFKLKDGSAIMIVTSGDARIDNQKYKKQFGYKVSMLNSEEVHEFSGHSIGGVCPFALPSGKMIVYLDVSLQRFSTVFPAAGSSNSAIELTCEELLKYSEAAAWIDVCRSWDPALK